MPYYKLTPELLEELNQINLKFSEYRLLLYCLSKDPYAQTWVNFSTAEMMRACNFKSHATLYMAMARLKELKLLSFVFDAGKFSTTPLDDGSTIATAIVRSLERSRFHHSDRDFTTAIEDSPESKESKDSENRKSLKRKSVKKAPRSEIFSEELDPGSQDYWNRLYGSN